jgi:hypothetical protein
MKFAPSSTKRRRTFVSHLPSAILAPLERTVSRNQPSTSAACSSDRPSARGQSLTVQRATLSWE